MKVNNMSKQRKFNIDNILNLARLNLNNKEKQNLTKDLDNILTYIEKLNELDTTSVEATSHVLNIENVYRDDSVLNTGTAAYMLHVLPDLRKEGKFFKVPKVIEDN